jgi:7-keto-8-aminopelargonate synthetase-like enzyme
MTEPEPLQQVNRTYVRYRGRKLISFSGCDYFRLASHPAVLGALQKGLKEFGLNVAASRLTTGNHPVYLRLEKQLAEFFGAADALLLPNGYVTTLAVAQALAGTFSHALLDERAHVALFEAAQSFNCPLLRFRHRDAGDFARTIARCGRGARPVAMTDGMFAHDGSVAPLRNYLKSLPRDGLLLVDDAHGAGVLGKTGRGTLEHENVGRERVVQCVTLSKAFGAYGGAVLGTPELREKMLSQSRVFIGSTPVPLPLACAASAAAKLLKAGKRLRMRLEENARLVRESLRSAGLALPAAPGPIVSLQIDDEWKAVLLKRQLLAAGIYPPLVHYPGGPPNGYFRFAISSEHSPAQLKKLITVLTRAAGELRPP